MGMAASQARYLGLTARKTNVEYEGQQVNQARTALANQSANTFNDLLNLEVPTAPSTQDYTKLKYTYVDGTTGEEISNMVQLQNDPDGYNYMVTHFHYANVYTGAQNKLSNPQVVLDKATGEPTYVGTAKLSKYDPEDSMQKSAYEQILKDWPDTDFAKATPENIYTWEFQGQRRFACKTDLIKTGTSAPDPTKPTENQNKLFYYVAQDVEKKIEKTERAFVGMDESNRPQTIRYEDSSLVFNLNTETVTDEAAYQDAMTKYNYDKQVYEKAIADINAKTEKLQQEDRTLELRLRQLDTEQEALQTEMDAVKKVIDKNIEQTFKTFDS